MKNVGLFFGSFNPIHIGHMAIANYMVEFTDMKEIWFIISPQNPFKEKKSLLEDHHRLDLANLAINNDPDFMASDIEFNMPRPSYTIDTLARLTERHPRYRFSLIMGSDSLPTFHKWKNYEQIIENHTRYVYPRPGVDLEEIESPENCVIVDAPLMEISSTFIREAIKKKKDIRYFMPSKAYRYMRDMHFYE
ncbi:MAG: nicotinate (nicotinamide) nucleotide adenylyltransferase [Bacteroidota bacterium]